MAAGPRVQSKRARQRSQAPKRKAARCGVPSGEDGGNSYRSGLFACVVRFVSARWSHLCRAAARLRILHGSLWRKRGSIAASTDPRHSLAPLIKEATQSKGSTRSKGSLELDGLRRLVFQDGAKASYEAAFVEYVSSASAARRGWSRGELVVLRGPPGLGKSTYASKALEAAGLSSLWKSSSSASSEASCSSSSVQGCPIAVRLAHVCSTDDFFTSISKDGREKYRFIPAKIGENHNKNQRRVRLAMSLGLSPLFVDNTNLAWWEVAPYVELADAGGYTVRFVEPHELHPEWDSVDFLVSRNRPRAAMGKQLDREILQRMVWRFEPLPPGRVGKRLSSARRRLPTYCGINVHKALVGQQFEDLWQSLADALRNVEGAHSLKLQNYVVPSTLHVTSFFHTELHGRALADAVISEGIEVKVHVVAVAFAVGCLACAVVSHVDPPVPAPPRKRLHVTLASAPPWTPGKSNDLLAALLDQHLPREELAADHTNVHMQPRPRLDFAELWAQIHGAQAGTADVAEAGLRPSASLKDCGRLHAEGLPTDAQVYLFRLERALVLRGRRFIHWD